MEAAVAVENSDFYNIYIQKNFSLDQFQRFYKHLLPHQALLKFYICAAKKYSYVQNIMINFDVIPPAAHSGAE